MRRLPLLAALFLPILASCARQPMKPTEVRTRDDLPARSSSTTSAVKSLPPMSYSSTTTTTVAPPTPHVDLPAPPPPPRLTAPNVVPKLSQTHTASPPCSGWLAEVQAVFGPATAKACSVLGCESRGDPQARNRSGASGLFQIMMPLHAGMFEAHGWPASSVFDGVRNITIAAEIVRGVGWGAWVCR